MSGPALIDETDPFFLNLAMNICIAVLKGHSPTASSTSNQMCQRHQQPIPLDPFRRTNLVSVKCQFVPGLPEEHLYWPPFHIFVQNFAGTQRYIRANESPQSFGNLECVFGVAVQHHRILNAVEASFIAIDIILPTANCHEADIGICFS